MPLPRLLPILPAALLLLTALPLAAQDTREARLEVAQKYVEASIADMDMDEVVRSMYRPLLDQLRASGMQIDAAKEAQVEALYLENMTEPMTMIMRAQDQVMADLFSLAEIEALYAFYQTPEGTAVMQKFPKLMEAQMPMIMETVQGKMAVMMPRLQEILQ